MFTRCSQLHFFAKQVLVIVTIFLGVGLNGCAGIGGSGGGNVNPAPKLLISTTSLANGQVGSPYSATLAASGGTAPYSWSLNSGTLPSGLSLNAATGTLNGTPIAPVASTSLTFRVTDSSNPAISQTANLSLTISPAALQITTSSLPSGQIGSAYTATLTATGGAAPYTWLLMSGTLPSGLSLNTASGVISGTPTITTTNVSLTFQVTDSSTPALTKTTNLTLTILPAGLQIATSSLPNGQVGTAYSTTLAAVGGAPPYSWSVTSGTLPAGISLNAATGTITGTPTTAINNAALTLQVADSSNPSLNKSANFTLTISPAPLQITTALLQNGQIGVAYNTTLAATGGTTPYSWSVTSGHLPTGLTLNPSTGAITGTPSVAVTSSPLTLQVSDSSNPVLTKSVNLSLTISPTALAITTVSLPSGQVGSTYSATLAASGGISPYTWSLTGGTLPSGLALNAATGAITGTPGVAIANASLTFQVKDAGSPAQTKSVNLTLTISPAGLVISTSSLPNAQVGSTYSATLAASGGTSPYTWSLTSGTLPSGLTLNASSGAITGTPSAVVANAPLTFQVKDSGSPAQTKTVNLTLTISGTTNISVTISPKHAELASGQNLAVTATVANDSLNQGVNWTASGGSFSASNSASGTAVTYTAPAGPGLFTITATSVTDGSKGATVPALVTNLPGVYTYHNDNSRDGSNPSEYALTTTNVKSATFGKLFSCAVDGAIYAQPLWVANLAVNGTKRNVVFVATQHESLYAFDADANPCVQLWHANLIDSAHGGASSETSVPSGPGGLVGSGSGDITPEVGVTGTPVIDPATNTIYVVSKSVIASGPTFFQRLHAISYSTGNELSNSPVTIGATYPGTGDGGSSDTFNPGTQSQRPGLALANGLVYIAWASHEDHPPYYGWVISYDKTTLAKTNVLNVSPNVGYGGIWMGGGAPAVDSTGNLFLITGNGTFDANSGSIPNNDYGDSFLKLTSGLTVSQYFTPSDESSDNSGDQDFGSGGAAILVDIPSSGTNPTHLVIGGGKDGYLYLLNRDNMGGLGDSHAWQRFYFNASIFATGAFWNNTFYLAGVGSHLQAYPFSTTSATFVTSNSSQSSANFGFPGSTPSVSSSGTTNGIVWALDNGQYCTPQSGGCGPTVLHAFDATNLGNELWNSGSSAGNAVKFTVPTIANGKVYVGTRGNNTGGTTSSSTVSGELDVFGLLP